MAQVHACHRVRAHRYTAIYTHTHACLHVRIITCVHTYSGVPCLLASGAVSPDLPVETGCLESWPLRAPGTWNQGPGWVSEGPPPVPSPGADWRLQVGLS